MQPSNAAEPTVERVRTVAVSVRHPTYLRGGGAACRTRHGASDSEGAARAGNDHPASPGKLGAAAAGIALLAASSAMPGLLVFALLLSWVAAGVLLLRRQPTTFGAGFLPYRTEDGWPHGVQEESDVRWRFDRFAAPDSSI